MLLCKRKLKSIVWWLCLSIISSPWNTSSSSSSLNMIVTSKRSFTGNNRRINADLTKVLTKQSIDYCPIQLHAKEIKTILFNASYHNQLFDIDTKTFTAAIRSCNSQEEYSTALEIFDLMNGSSTATPDRLTYGVAMTACMHTANSKQADILFQRCNKKFKYGSSKKYNIEDTAMFSLMIATWDVVGSWSKVIVTYDEINALEGLKPSVDMINSVLRASKRQQDWVKYDNVVSTLAVLGNIKRNYSTNDSVIAPSEEQVNNDSSVLSRKSMNECLISLEASSTTDDIGAAIAQVTAESPDHEGMISLLINKLESILTTDLVFMQLLASDSRLRRRIKRLLDKLIVGPSVVDDELVVPSLGVYKTMIRREGMRNNSLLAFRLFREALSMMLDDISIHEGSNSSSSQVQNNTPAPDESSLNTIVTSYSPHDKKGLYRCLIEACAHADDQVLLTEAKLLLHVDFEGCNSHMQEEAAAVATGADKNDDIEPTSTFCFNGQDYVVKNGPSDYSRVTRKLVSILLNTSSLYRKIDISALPERGLRIPTAVAKDMLSLHCEKQALSGLLQLNSLSDKPFDKTSLFVRVNLCMCDDCHTFFKAASQLLKVGIKCKDPSGTHLFDTDGVCSCSDHWGGR